MSIANNNIPVHDIVKQLLKNYRLPNLKITQESTIVHI